MQGGGDVRAQQMEQTGGRVAGSVLGAHAGEKWAGPSSGRGGQG